MPRAITILTEQFADWETGLFNATARLYYSFDTRFATPQGKSVLAQAGLLDQLRHTSNCADNLASLPGYAGALLYQDVPHAVADQRVITAPGTAPVTFAAAVLAALGIADDGLKGYLALHAAEHGQQA